MKKNNIGFIVQHSCTCGFKTYSDGEWYLNNHIKKTCICGKILNDSYVTHRKKESSGDNI